MLQGPTLLKKLATAAKENGLDGIGLINMHGKPTTAILMHREGFGDDDIISLASSVNIRVLCLADIMNRSPPLAAGRQPKVSREDLATIVYTSGTTGRPKGLV